MDEGTIGISKEDSIEKVRAIALEAGYAEARLSSTSDRIVIPVHLEAGRLQYVYIHFREDFATACSSSHSIVATVFSTCLKLTEDDLQLDRPALAWQLLEENSKIPFGRYAVVETGKESKYALIVSCDHIIDTLDPEELILMVEYVAKIADGFENSHNFGTDDY